MWRDPQSSRLMAQAQQLVETGWFRSLDALCTVALRRFLESHREDLMEAFIRPHQRRSDFPAAAVADPIHTVHPPLIAPSNHYEDR